MRMDAHTSYAENYISRCVSALQETDADNVGGILKVVPRVNTLLGQSIVCSLSHIFGIGNAYFRFASSNKRQWVDTVPFFCCKREVFNKVGFFNEQLIRSEDMELNVRIRKQGGKILLDPTILCTYYARSDLISFWKHNIKNGTWAILPFRYSKVIPVSLRHLVPLAFVSVLLITSILSLFDPAWSIFLIAFLCLYLTISLIASLQISFHKKDIRFLLFMPFVFASLHIGYGLGSLYGLITVYTKRQ